MTCGCSNNNTNNRNNINNPQKLYQNTGQNANQSIVSLACGGTPTTDIYKSKSETGGLPIYRGEAYACKFTPTSRCLDLIIFLGAKSR